MCVYHVHVQYVLISIRFDTHGVWCELNNQAFVVTSATCVASYYIYIIGAPKLLGALQGAQLLCVCVCVAHLFINLVKL